MNPVPLLIAFVVIVTFASQTSAATRMAELAEAARSCAAQDRLLYPVDGLCYIPASDGPCNHDRNEFFVLDTSRSGWLGRCVQRPCPDGQIKWTDGTCYDGIAQRNILCPTPGHIVGLDAYGVGQCVCDYYHAKHANSTDPRCYLLYTRGPCPEKAVMVPKPKGRRSQAVCAWDPCHQYQQEGELVWLFWDMDGRCHQTLTPDVCTCPPVGKAPADACGPDFGFRVRPDTLKPGCMPSNVLNLTPDAKCNGCQTTQTEQFDRRILYRGGS